MEGCLISHGFRTFSRSSGWLNNSGAQTISLKNLAGEIVDQISYGEGGVVTIPSEGKSAGRDQDGSSNWVIFDNVFSRNNDCVLPSPTNTPSPTPSLTPTPTPQTKATYKINQIKDSEGNLLSGVKIYVDDNYIHHEDEELLTFCEGCYCDDDKNINCGLGEHNIKLEKDGYNNWSESKNLVAGNNFEVNPVISPDSPTSTPTPTATLTPSPTSTIKPTLVPTMFKTELDGSGSANFEQVLGTQNSDSQGYDISLEGSTGSAEGLQTNKKKINFWPLLFIIPGAGMVCFSLLVLAKQKKPLVDEA